MDGMTWHEANDFLWKYNARLHVQVESLRVQLAERRDVWETLVALQEQHEQLKRQNDALRRRIGELTEQLKESPRPKTPVPAFIKPNLPDRRIKKKPGRKAGHAAAVRPMPATIDVHQTVPLPIDTCGHASCPDCKTQLADVKQHERIVEDIIPSKVVTTCYHTTSGYCPSCRKSVESRATEQPPAWDLPHAQLGLNALCTAAVMRVCYRLPLRQVSGLLAQLPGLKVSPAAVAKQLERLSGWLDGQYHRLKLSLRMADVVHADETGWRTNGRNTQLWTLTNDRHTLYKVDASRGRKVIQELLGEHFGAEGRGTLVSDFYSVYDKFDGPQQKCLAHLLRELRDCVRDRPELAGHRFFKKCKRLIRDMLRLRTRRQALPTDDYARQITRIEQRLAKLAQGGWDDPDADRLSARLRKHLHRLTTFLHRPEVDPTNNAAERALRPAVVMRKITGGNRSTGGAQAWAVVASVMRTAQQQGRDVLETLKTLLQAHWSGQQATLLTELLLPDTS